MTKNEWFISKKDQIKSGYIQTLNTFHLYNIYLLRDIIYLQQVNV